MNKRLFIVSNRLPVTVEQNAGDYTLRPSSGGLVSAISAWLDGEGKSGFSETFWVGTPGCSEKIWKSALSHTEHRKYTYVPVFVHPKKYELYYNGFSNSVLWPLFHYFPSFVEYNPAYYTAFAEVNELFASLLEGQLQKGDIVWIHDYHLLPLAGILRNKFPSLSIGFFLHIPFPSFELFRMIPKPWQQYILSGMLGADLIGFHTMEYVMHFLSSVEELLKIENDGPYLYWKNRQIKADAFPISIDYDLFHNAYDDPKVAELRQQYLRLKGDRKMIFSVDRLDYTKGISRRLKGYELFLKENPGYAGKVVFSLVVVPSRDTILKYAERKQIIDETVGNLNSGSGDLTWQPVVYNYGHLSFQELVALYTACDLALITPVRDGMNLVAKEFVASRKDESGVLILSEMAGAAKELTEAILVNPNDLEEMAMAIRQGLEMEETEKADRVTAMQERVRRYNVHTWVRAFFDQLNSIKGMQDELDIKFLDEDIRQGLLKKYAAAQKRLILLDYDGSLVPFARFPSAARPGTDILTILTTLSADPKNDIYIVSGRDSVTLETWFSHLPIGLIAEHGAKIRRKNATWKNTSTTQTGDWYPHIEKVMENYVSLCAHTFIEKKELSIAWHYRNADLIEGAMRARELYDELNKLVSPLSLNVLNGNKVIEVRVKGINKGAAIAKIIPDSPFDFILCIGDDVTDEDMFRQLHGIPEAYAIKVGNEPSDARYNVYDPPMVQSLLREIVL